MIVHEMFYSWTQISTNCEKFSLCGLLHCAFAIWFLRKSKKNIRKLKIWLYVRCIALGLKINYKLWYIFISVMFHGVFQCLDCDGIGKTNMKDKLLIIYKMHCSWIQIIHKLCEILVSVVCFMVCLVCKKIEETNTNVKNFILS